MNRVEELKDDIIKLGITGATYRGVFTELCALYESELARLRADLAEAVEALRPFRTWCEHIMATGSRRLAESESPPISGCPSMGDLRRARSIVNRQEGK